MHLSKTVSTAALLAVIALPLSAGTIGMTLDSGHTTSQRSGAIPIPFTLSAATSFNSGLATYTWTSANSPFVQGSLSGIYAKPPGMNDNETYLTVGSQNGYPDPVSVNFSTPILYFGFYMGSPDDYNKVDVYDENSVATPYSGTDFYQPANGNQGIGTFVNFEALSGSISRIDFISSSIAFENGNHALSTTTPTPEPASMFMLGGGLILLGSIKRKRIKAAILTRR